MVCEHIAVLQIRGPSEIYKLLPRPLIAHLVNETRSGAIILLSLCDGALPMGEGACETSSKWVRLNRYEAPPHCTAYSQQLQIRAHRAYRPQIPL